MLCPGSSTAGPSHQGLPGRSRGGPRRPGCYRHRPAVRYKIRPGLNPGYRDISPQVSIRYYRTKRHVVKGRGGATRNSSRPLRREWKIEQVHAVHRQHKRVKETKEKERGEQHVDWKSRKGRKKTKLVVRPQPETSCRDFMTVGLHGGGPVATVHLFMSLKQS
ncbi:uncharacterized protein LOC142768889 [Rhipicephalus microplus]|uniref:uncharacterized protein LOC142768889 n=1 Tax=Rhipicephalus microplus TaxID=6941 RepID=UPI003F6B0FBD